MGRLLVGGMKVGTSAPRQHNKRNYASLFYTILHHNIPIFPMYIHVFEARLTLYTSHNIHFATLRLNITN